MYRVLYNETVAVKIFSRNDNVAIKEWDNEVRILKILDSPHVVHYIGSCYDNRGYPMIVMEFGGIPFKPFYHKQYAESKL